ncbi:MAG: PAS domain-containing sensor histidine kinase [Burkholderiales bacterium]|nr:PAS domain-containing sensor histidine kinase [Anaerolineae bacterium]
MIVNEMLHAALDSIYCAAFAVHGDDICFANSAALSLFGVSSPDDLRSLAVSDLIPSNFHDALQGWPSQTLSLAPCEVKLNVQLNSEVWVQLSAQPLMLEDMAVSLVTAIDITRQKQAETQAYILQQVIDAVPDPLYTKDRDLSFSSVNRAMRRSVGMDEPDKLIGHTASEIYGSKFPLVYDMEQRLMQTGEPLLNREMCIESQMQSGESAWYSVNKMPLYDVDDRIIGMIGVHHDIEEVRRLRAALLDEEQRRADFEIEKSSELNEFKKHIMVRVSHEFRTPLTVISTAGYLLENHTNRLTDERRDFYFRQIDTQIGHMTDMLDELALVMRGLHNHLEFKPTTFNVIDLCNRVVEEAGLRGNSERQIEFTVEGQPSIVTGDAKQMWRILMNLLDNALRFSPLTKPVYFNLLLGAGVVTLQIRDEGIGISAQDLPHIFEPLYRGSNINEVFGLGIGLSIVKDAVDLCDGTISVESAPGLGSTFTVRLPAG